MAHRREHQHDLLLVMPHIGRFLQHLGHQHDVVRTEVGKRGDVAGELVAEHEAQGFHVGVTPPRARRIEPVRAKRLRSAPPAPPSRPPSARQAHAARPRRGERVLHLHRLDHREPRARFDDLPFLDEQRDQPAVHRGDDSPVSSARAGRGALQRIDERDMDLAAAAEDQDAVFDGVDRRRRAGSATSRPSRNENVVSPPRSARRGAPTLPSTRASKRAARRHQFEARPRPPTDRRTARRRAAGTRRRTAPPRRRARRAHRARAARRRGAPDWRR